MTFDTERYGKLSGVDSYYKTDGISAEYIKATDLLTINEENELTRKIGILEVKADKIEDVQQTI